MRLKFLLTSLIAIFVLTPLSAEAADDSDDFENFHLEAEGDAEFLNDQGIPPPGANDPECRLEEGENPVVLVPGTFARSSYNFLSLSPDLADQDYCVYAMNYGFTFSGPSTAPIEASAEELQTFTDNVLNLTEADQVDIIGHSQGGMMPRYYLKFLEGDENVDNLIGLAPSNHGTDGLLGFRKLTGIGSTIIGCEACDQQLTGSAFLEELNEGDETPGDVSYTNIATKADGVVKPYTSGFLDGPEDQVSNIKVQDHLPYRYPTHVTIAFDKQIFEIAYDALENEGPADPGRALASESASVSVSEDTSVEISEEELTGDEKQDLETIYERLSPKEQEQVIEYYIEDGQPEIAEELDEELFAEMEN